MFFVHWVLGWRLTLTTNTRTHIHSHSSPYTHTETVCTGTYLHSKIVKSEGSGELIVVGAFDTTFRNSQVLYCSVGRWNGRALQKVGEGLCNAAVSRGMKITTAAFAGPDDVYVAGSFNTQVWNGNLNKLVQIFNIAHYNAVTKVWLPLNVGQITCSWCTVTVLALAWDPKRLQLNIAGKFDAINGQNVPAGLAVYDLQSGRLLAHPGGGLTMKNTTQDGVGTALQLDEEKEILYVMGSFERLTATNELCFGMAAYEIQSNTWTCLANTAHSVLPSGGGIMLITPHGLAVAGLSPASSTWHNASRPYTIALLNTTRKKGHYANSTGPVHHYQWTWLPGFQGHDEPIHALSNGFGSYAGYIFIGGDNLVAQWYQKKTSKGKVVSIVDEFQGLVVQGAIMAISQMIPKPEAKPPAPSTSSGGSINYYIIVYCVSLGTIIGMLMAIVLSRNGKGSLNSIFGRDANQIQGISLDTLTYGAFNKSNIGEAYKRAMQTRYVSHPHLLTLIDPQEIFLQRIIGEGTFGRVWSARWRSSKVAVKEFVFAQTAVAGKSKMQGEIVEEIIGEAGMMAILRHPNVLQLFGCSLTAQAIWIVSELCSLGSLRQLLDSDRAMPTELRINMALQVAEGMMYLHNQDTPIIHRDLKSHNIFVHETFTEVDVIGGPELASIDGSQKQFRYNEESPGIRTQSTIVVKIGDWGSARATLSGSRTMTRGVGTACWLAPEVINNARSSKYSDVYSYAIVLWEMATREEVYPGLEATQIIAKVANESLRPSVPKDCLWADMMVQCWAENPLERMEFSDIVDEFTQILHMYQSRSRGIGVGGGSGGAFSRVGSM